MAGAKLGDAVPAELSVVTQADRWPWVPAAEQRTSLTPSSVILVWRVWWFYALQLVDEFSDASGDVLVECAASNRREDA